MRILFTWVEGSEAESTQYLGIESLNRHTILLLIVLKAHLSLTPYSNFVKFGPTNLVAPKSTLNQLPPIDYEDSMKNTIKLLVCVAVVTLSFFSVSAFSADEKYTAETSMEVILFNPELRKAMAKHVPDLMGNPEIDQASVISLGELAGYVPDQLNDEVIKAILEDLNKVE